MATTGVYIDITGFAVIADAAGVKQVVRGGAAVLPAALCKSLAPQILAVPCSFGA
jgi:hypothetical protein